MEKIYLGTISKNTKANVMCKGEMLSIEKHSWDCGWYWGFGYIGNKHLHMHIEALLPHYDFKDLWDHSFFTDKQWWTVYDLYKQAYALKAAAETYRLGGHMTTNEHTQLLKNKEKEDMINADLKLILDKVWDFMQEASKEAMEREEAKRK